MPVQVKAVGLEAILKKLNIEYLGEPVRRRLFRDVGMSAREFLDANVPRDTGASARTMSLSVRDAGYTIDEAGARLAVTSYPLRYVEFGTRVGDVKKQIRLGSIVTRTVARTGSQRIKPRRFMAKTIRKARAEMKRKAEDAAREIEKRWSS